MICLDTTFLIDLFKNRLIVDKNLEILLNKKLFITPFSVFELYHGIHRLKRKQPKFDFEKREKKIKSFYEKFPIIDYSLEASIKTAEIFDFLERQGLMIDIIDIMIASVALISGCKRILTRNSNHFDRIPGIEAISYSLKINQNLEPKF